MKTPPGDLAIGLIWARIHSLTNKNYGALSSRTYVNSQFDFGRQSYSMTVRGIYNAEVDDATGPKYMTDHTASQYRDTIWCTILFLK